MEGELTEVGSEAAFGEPNCFGGSEGRGRSEVTLVHSVLNAGHLAGIHHGMDAGERGAAVTNMLALASALVGALAFAGPGEADRLACVLGDDVVAMLTEHTRDGAVLALLEAAHESSISVGADNDVDPSALSWRVAGAGFMAGWAAFRVIPLGGIHQEVPPFRERGEAGDAPGMH